MEKLVVVDGNHAAALGALLCRPDVVAAYPITPQTPLVEHFTQYIADGALDCAILEPESEHSAMSILEGASLAGGRTFTATSSQGLALMYEPYFRASTMRLPIVMDIVNREMISPQTIWGGPQDSLSVRDAGWIQIYVEDNQEILDMNVQAFKIAEHKDVLLPVNICFDGFYLSHMTEGVLVCEQEKVDAFLPKYLPEHVKLDPERPMAVDPLTPGAYLQYYRELHMQAMDNAKKVIRQVNDEFAQLFGRSYGGLVDTYRLEDADYVLITMGSLTGTARVAVDYARQKGVKAGILKLRSIRPFPKELVQQYLKGRKAAGVVDRNVSFGWHCGITYLEVLSAMGGALNMPLLPFIGGLGGEDLTIQLLAKAIDYIVAAGKGRYNTPQQAIWLIKGEEE
ncbi:MAG: transketolase C-terminal domain-containing protein [Clostridiales bacterium]